MKIKERIRKHYKVGIRYYILLGLVFPEEDYPRAFQCSSNGGPPGCAMAFGRALREMGGRRYGGQAWIPREEAKNEP